MQKMTLPPKRNFAFMEELPEQIERIILAKLSPRDRKHLLEAFPYLGDIYQPLISSGQVVEFPLVSYDIDWSLILSFVKDLGTSLQKYLVYQDRNADTMCAGIKSFIQSKESETQVEEFAAFIIDDIEQPLSWEPFFYMIGKSSAMASLYINIKDNFSMIYNDEVQEIWHRYKTVMGYVLDYFHKLGEAIWNAVHRNDPISLRIIKSGFMYGSNLSSSACEDHWLVYDPYEYPTDDLKIESDILKLNQTNQTLCIATMNDDAIIRLLGVIYSFTRVTVWHGMNDFDCTTIPSDPLVRLFPEVPLQPRWSIDAEENCLIFHDL